MDAVFHLLIPLLLVKLFKPNIPTKYLFLLLPLAVFFDLDGFLGMKKAFHSVLLIAVIILVIFILTRKTKDGQTILGVAAFYMFSHLLLDFGRPMAPFYPLSEAAYSVEMNVTMQGFLPLFNFSVNRLDPSIVNMGLEIGSPISEIGFGFLLMLLFLLAWAFLGKRGRRSR